MTTRLRLEHDWFPRPVPDNVLLGEGTWLYSAFAFLHYRSRQPVGVRVGRSCGIYNGSFFELGPSGELVVGDFSTLVGVIVATNDQVRIGSYCFLAHEVVIADSYVAAPPRRAGPATTGCAGGNGPGIRLGNDVWVGAGAVLLRGAIIGDGAVVGAGAVVDFAVQANSVVAGNPARVVCTPGGGALS